MARPRAYNHDIRCPDCGSNWMPKNGASKGRQVYRYGDCDRYYTYGDAYTRPSAADREQGIALYGEGVSLSAAARSFGVTPPAVHRWVKKGSGGSARRAGQQPAAVIDCVCCNVDLPAGAARR